MSKSGIVSEKDYYAIKSGTTLFEPRIDQFGAVTLIVYQYKGKRVRADLDSVWMLGYMTDVYVFNCKGKWNSNAPGRYPYEKTQRNVFWTRRAALRYAQEAKMGLRPIDPIKWVRRIRKVDGYK